LLRPSNFATFIISSMYDGACRKILLFILHVSQEKIVKRVRKFPFRSLFFSYPAFIYF